MNSKKLKILYKKEIMDVIRDKKTVFTMVVLPIILYPVLFLVVMQVIMLINQSQQEKTYYIAYDKVSDEYRNLLDDWISGKEDELDYVIKEVESVDPKKDLDDEVINAYITVKETEGQVVYEINYLSAVTDSSVVCGMLKEEISSLAKKMAEENAVKAGLDVKQVLYPIEKTSVDLSTNESAMGSILGSVIPFLLITSILMGAMYPAIDATAGEKERGTLETLLTLPVNNLEMIMSKFLSVATIAVVSVLINVASMGVIAIYLFATMSSLTEGTAEFHAGSFVPAILISIVCVIAFSLFMSALVMCVCAFAKSFKEANNYVTPLTLVVMFTGYIGFIPNVELDMKTALIPVANICLLMKSLLVFKYDFILILLVLLSNIIYAFIAVWFLGRIYDSESILFGESLSGIKLFERRKNIKKGSIPSVQESILVFVVMLLLSVYVGGIMSLNNVRMGIIVPQIIIVSLPVLASIYIKGDLKKIFALHMPKGKDVVGSFFLLLGAGSLSLLISNLLNFVLKDEVEGVTDIYTSLVDGLPFGMALLLMALLPAVCEEMLFRGYMFTAFRQKMSLWKAILFVSVLFGVSHMSLVKLIPTAVLGAGLAYAFYKADSILVSLMMHFLNNALATYVLYYGDKITFLNEKRFELPLMVGMAALAVLFIPAGVKILNKRKKKLGEESEEKGNC